MLFGDGPRVDQQIVVGTPSEAAIAIYQKRKKDPATQWSVHLYEIDLASQTVREITLPTIEFRIAAQTDK